MPMFNHLMPNRICLIDTPPDGGGAGNEDGGKEPRMFTQEQVNEIIETRLAKERGKYKDYDELKAKAMRLDEAENAGNSELDELREANAALQKRIDDAETARQQAQWVSEIAKDRDIPAELLRGSTKEEIQAHADQLDAVLHPKSKAAPVGGQTEFPSHQQQNAGVEYVRRLFGGK